MKESRFGQFFVRSPIGIFLLVFLVGTSCKTYQKVDWIKPNLPVEERSKYFEPRQLSRLSEGDHLSVLTTDSTAYEITFKEIRNDSIQGSFTRKNSLRIRVPFESGIPISDISVLKVKEVNGWLTFAVFIAIPGTFLLVALRHLNTHGF
ncbi:hypothetical protein V8V91_27390 [Algoriphagus halophilus]|uniref:hypothetical protein n=1 Tax=Algoriphagus halophilus TaxID=226505 RepID=UPI00358FF3D3